MASSLRRPCLRHAVRALRPRHAGPPACARFGDQRRPRAPDEAPKPPPRPPMSLWQLLRLRIVANLRNVAFFLSPRGVRAVYRESPIVTSIAVVS